MAQPVRHPTLDLSSGHDLKVHGFEPHVGLCSGSVEPVWDSLSPSPSASPLHMLYLFLSLNKETNKHLKNNR